MKRLTVLSVIFIAVAFCSLSLINIVDAAVDYNPFQGGVTNNLTQTAETQAVSIERILPVIETSQVLQPVSESVDNQNSGETAGPSKWGSLQGYVEEVLPFRLSVDYSQILTPDTNVLMFGETHEVAQVKTELANNMALFRQLGFTHLGLEMFQSDAQGMLDQYCETGANRNEVLQYLDEVWGWPGMAELYLKLIDATIAQGIKIVALDMPHEQQDAYEGVLEQTQARNEYMSNIINNIILQDGNSRIVTLNGSAHLGGMSDIMREQYAIGVTSVNFVGGKQMTEVDGVTVNEGGLIERAAREAKLEYTKFMVDVDGGNLAPPCDWFIHLPQREPPSALTIAFASIGIGGSEPQYYYFRADEITPPDITKGGYEDEPVSLFPEDLFKEPGEEYTGITMHKDGKRYSFKAGEPLEIMYYKRYTHSFSLLGDWTISDRPPTRVEYDEFKTAIEQAIQDNPANSELQRLYNDYFPKEPPDYLTETTESEEAPNKILEFLINKNTNPYTPTTP